MVAEVHPVNGSDRATRSALRVLVIDDNSASRKEVTDIVRDVLSNPQAIVQEATGAEQALRNLDGQTWDIVVCDVKLSDAGDDLRGLDVMEYAANLQSRPFIIGVSGFYDQTTAGGVRVTAAAARMGANAFIPRGMAFVNYAALLREWLLAASDDVARR